MHNAPSSLSLAVTLITLFGTPLLLNAITERVIRARASRRRICERLADIRRDSFDVRQSPRRPG